MLLAHREVDDKGNILGQLLSEHLNEVGKRGGEIGREVGLEAFMKLAGYLHDVGKADRNFQKYIQEQTKKRVNHSSAGGRILEDLICSNQELESMKNNRQFRYFQEILTYVIFAHHGLYDQLNYGDTEINSSLRFHYDEEGDYHYKEDVIPFVQNFGASLYEKGEEAFQELIKVAFEEFKVIYNELLKLSRKNIDKEMQREEKEYYMACLTRLCLAILKEADIYDSANAFSSSKQILWQEEETHKVWEEASKRIERMYQKYKNSSNPSEINVIRNDLADLAKEAAEFNDNGIFKLELPTGAGKTKAGLRYALTNAKKYNRDRIFYITAYLSVLEQNAKDIKDMIQKDEVVLEHHSNMVVDLEKDTEGKDDNAEYEYHAYLKESWETPIILTTMVQFFNTLYKDKAANIRRFCKLINSVIIIDEVQSLPIKVLSNFNLMMNFMKTVMHCNIVHCTATQPILDSNAMKHKLYYGDNMDENSVIVNGEQIGMECFHRVDFYNLAGRDGRRLLSTEQLFTYIEKELRIFDSCLVILNTKSAVATLCDYLENNLLDTEIIYLTTNLCAANRLDIISDMKVKLQQNREGQAHHKIVCVSTRLIEAGVDVDFDVVFRSLAGIDSLIQCAGRCNREGLLMRDGHFIHGKLYIIRYTEESLSNLPDIKATADASEYAIRSQKDIKNEDNTINMETLQKPYFNKYYIENKNKMDYVDRKRNTSMLEDLGRNQQARDAYIIGGKHKTQKILMFQSFKTAAQKFELIGKETIGVIVCYKNQDLLDELEQAMEERDYVNVKRLLQQLQRYTVNMYLSPKIEAFIGKNDEAFNVYFLGKEYYNGKKGVNIEHFADLIV